jgi:hypothetical protein
MQRPEEPNIIREALALVYAANLPLAAEHAVVDAALVDAMAKAGRAHGECHYRWRSIITAAMNPAPANGNINRSQKGHGAKRMTTVAARSAERMKSSNHKTSSKVSIYSSERLSLHLILRRVRQRAFVLEDLAEIAALKPAAAGRTADEVFGIILRRKLNYSAQPDADHSSSSPRK